MTQEPRVHLHSRLNPVTPNPPPIIPSITPEPRVHLLKYPRPVTPTPLLQSHTKPRTVPGNMIPWAPYPIIHHNKTFFSPARNQHHHVTPGIQWFAQHIFDDTGKKLSLDELLKGPKKVIWHQAISNELGRLSMGIPGKIKGTKAMRYIHRKDVPKGKKITYANMVCDYRPLKSEQYRVRLTIGGDKLEYNKDTASPAANLLDTKILLNSTISDAKRGARFMSLDIKDFFLMSPLPIEDREYMRIHSRYFSDDYIKENNLHDYINADGYIYCEILLGMYGLKQAAILAYKQLKERLEPAGYYPIPDSNGLWAHKTRKTIFALCVDDFGIKYFSEEDANHLVTTLKKY